MKWHQEICLEIPEILIEQSVTYKESRRALPIGNISRTMAENQYQYYKTII